MNSGTRNETKSLCNCDSRALSLIDLISIHQQCRGYHQEAKFVEQVQRQYMKLLKRICICICDKSQRACPVIPFCIDSGGWRYDVLIIDGKTSICEEVELKLDVRSSTEAIEKFKEAVIRKFNYSCCADYCKKKYRTIVFKERNTAEAVRKNLVKQMSRVKRIKMNITSVDTLTLSLFTLRYE
uniref:Uncharacterized protein n=1 Tax=Ignisphaera aggregans TaxID=334771 RepID=A0A7J3Z6W8_9CREN